MDIKNILIQKLENISRDKLNALNVVVLPDFFVDHFLNIENQDETLKKIKNISAQGGGNIHGINQSINLGGNAANTAIALARIGIKSHLICKTSKLGSHLLDYFIGDNNVDTSRVKKDGKIAITTALEFRDNNSNIMLGDVGSVSDFSFDDLNEGDLELISNADVVCVLCWNLNRYGTSLAKRTFELAKKHSTKTYFDTGDPSPKKDEIPVLIKDVFENKNLDILALNENELGYYADQSIRENIDVKIATKDLKKNLTSRIDVHTKDFSFTSSLESEYIPSFSLENIYRMTGAGDTWNAGNIFAELNGFDDKERLFFANAVAACYLSNPEPVRPNLDQVINFLKSC